MICLMENQKRMMRSIMILVLFSLSFTAAAMAAESTSTIPVNVGVVVDLDEVGGKMYLTCIEMALSDFYASHAQYKTRVVLNTTNSHEDVVGAADAALDLIKNVEVKAIIGPMTSMQASFVVNLGDKAHVPIISFSATSPFLTSLRSSYFFQFLPDDSIQVKAISGIVQNFGWRRVVPIYVDNMYGEGIMPFLIDALLDVDVHVPYRSVISQTATDDEIEIELYKLMMMQTRVFIVHMMPNLASQLFVKAKEVGMMDKGFVWITTNGIGDHLKAMEYVQNSMQGVLSVETDVSDTLKLKEFKARWKKQFHQDYPEIIDVNLDSFGYRAYDAVFAIAMAVEEVGNASFGFQKENSSPFNSTDLGSLKVSQYGSNFSNALALMSFTGLAGNFNLVDRKLQLSDYKIVNVNGIGNGRTVGYWTLENERLVKQLNSKNSCNVSTFKCDALGPIIWPGESSSVPKGWEIPENSKKLRIGVPVRDGFTEFVKVTRNLITNTTEVTGFSIDVFKAVVDKLPYALPHELIPYAYPNGTSAGTYNDLIYQVYLGNFDAVVGDATIRANRTLHVDFAMPYTESGVVMVVPIIDNRTKNAWVFLQPLTLDLWMTILCFFIFIGFVIWVLEHRINEDFRGSPSHQVGTSFWFSFSTMVFSHRERVVSNLGRFVMIIWVFVVLIVTQSYTANLASYLTVQHVRPTVNNLHDLLRYGEYVGYMRGAFVYDLLIQEGFPDTQLKSYESMEEIVDALSKGSASGGIAAIVHETPYMKLFVAKYCTYAMIGPIFKTDGFGFAFPKHSSLVSDVTQAILNLTDYGLLTKIEDEWIKADSQCKDSTINFSNNALGLESFWGLFLLAGIASIFALVVFATSFLCEHKHILLPSDSNTSKRKRIKAMFEIFNEKRLSSHKFRSSRHSDNIIGAQDHEVKPSSINNNGSDSPQSFTNHTYATSIFSHDQETSSRGQTSPETAPTFELAIIVQGTQEVNQTTISK